MTHLRSIALGVAALWSLSAVSCSDYRRDHNYAVSSGSGDHRSSESDETIRRFREKDPTLERFFNNSVGYAVLPVVTKGGLGIGAAHGDHGVLYERGMATGEVEVTQVTLGAQIGGQDFAEIIFFQHDTALNDFKSSNTEFAANASAVAASSGAASSSDFANGVAVFTLPLGGLMAEASIGGQKFKYIPFDRMDTRLSEGR